MFQLNLSHLTDGAKLKGLAVPTVISRETNLHLIYLE